MKQRQPDMVYESRAGISFPAGSTVLIIGLGLIGGSIARGLKKHVPSCTVLAVDSDPVQLEQARDSGAIDGFSSEVDDLAPQADLVVVAVPTLAVENVFRSLSGKLRRDAVITDVASVKGSVEKAARQVLGDGCRVFVPGHPIAGSEKSGFNTASADLFQNRKVILTPMAQTSHEAVLKVNCLWRSLGAEVLGMASAQHDEVLAATSHLPHLLSYALVDVLLQQTRCEEIFRYAAGGFADFSRLASSDPTMWADIFVANGEATVQVLDHYIAQLGEFRRWLISGDHATLRSRFSQAKHARDNFIRKHYQAMKENITEASRQVRYQVAPGGKVAGDIRVPGDKSISHRSVMFGAIADGVTRISGFLEGEDALNTLAAFRELGVTIAGPDRGELTIHGVGKSGLQAPRKPLYMGNSGTAMRLLCGLLAAQPFDSELTGDESLTRRPMKRVTEPLQQMGASIETGPTGTPPLVIRGSSLRGIDYTMPMASAQVKSCLLLAGLYAEGRTSVTEPASCRDHTERMLSGFGYPVQRAGATVTVQGGGRLAATTIDIPADISSAAFFLVAAAVSPGADLILRHVGVNPTRTGIIDLLSLMGARIERLNEREVGGEPVADLRVVHGPLQAITVPESLIPLAIDEFPVFFIAAACAAGTTVLHGAEELRVKESDRIQAMADGLAVLGVVHETFPDGIAITGSPMGGGVINSHGDHRIAMAFTVASLRAKAPITILDCANVATSFPGFVELAAGVGIPVKALTDGEAP